MAALWSWGSTPIFVEEDTFKREVYNAVLKVLDATTNVIQNYGGGSERRELRGIVVTQANLDTILSDAVSGTSRTLTSDLGGEGTFIIDGEVTAERIRHAGAVIDGTSYGVSTPIFRVSMSLISTA